MLWVLRTDLELTGTKYGCGTGLCGACTVIVDGKASRSCQTPLKEVESHEVLTIEGLAGDGKLHPLQQAFIDHGGLQCGYCTPGMIMNALCAPCSSRHPSREAIVGRHGAATVPLRRAPAHPRRDRSGVRARRAQIMSDLARVSIAAALLAGSSGGGIAVFVGARPRARSSAQQQRPQSIPRTSMPIC